MSKKSKVVLYHEKMFSNLTMIEILKYIKMHCYAMSKDNFYNRSYNRTFPGYGKVSPRYFAFFLLKIMNMNESKNAFDKRTNINTKYDYMNALNSFWEGNINENENITNKKNYNLKKSSYIIYDAITYHTDRYNIKVCPNCHYKLDAWHTTWNQTIQCDNCRKIYKGSELKSLKHYEIKKIKIKGITDYTTIKKSQLSKSKTKSKTKSKSKIKPKPKSNSKNKIGLPNTKERKDWALKTTIQRYKSMKNIDALKDVEQLGYMKDMDVENIMDRDSFFKIVYHEPETIKRENKIIKYFLNKKIDWNGSKVIIRKIYWKDREVELEDFNYDFTVSSGIRDQRRGIDELVQESEEYVELTKRTYYHNQTVPKNVSIALDRYGLKNIKVVKGSSNRTKNNKNNSDNFSISEQREIFKAISYAKTIN